MSKNTNRDEQLKRGSEALKKASTRVSQQPPYSKKELREDGKKWRDEFNQRVTVTKNGVNIPTAEVENIKYVISMLEHTHYVLAIKFGSRKNNAERQFLKFLRDDIGCIQDLLSRCK